MLTETITAPRVAHEPARQFVYPKVRSVPRPTAHPAAEAWPATTWEQRQTARFVTLQTRMRGVAAPDGGPCERSVVIVPSRDVEGRNESPAVSQAYEERLLCSLLRLRDPGLRMTYLTSSPVAPAIVAYYLSLLPRRIRAGARSRLAMVSVGEAASRPLSAKLLERPELLERVRATITDSAACHLVPYSTSCLERDLALALDIPMYGADPRHAFLGTKSGCRALFARVGVPHPLGAERITSFDDVVRSIAWLRSARPTVSRAVLKCNDGVSGEGNATVDLRGLPEPGAGDEVRQIAQRVRALRPEAPGVDVLSFLDKLARGGGVVEEWISARELRSPSVQLQITPAGEVHVVSTHDQILGGPTGQSYLGCRFPADAEYAPAISEVALRVGRELARVGVIGRLAIDFVVARDARRGWQPHAIELNLRKGGTTHPYETLVSLTGGSYDPDSATFRTPAGEEKHYVATDHLEGPQFSSLGRDGALSLARREDLRFHPLQRTGVVLHMLSSLDQAGRAGFTAIANSAHDADLLYEHTGAELERAAEACQRAAARGQAVGRVSARAA